ncbi:phosphoglycolate phosphatase [Clostridia bacterium]|nr:phosphoglycolate phosphatase [Clostridia bacterium]
MRFKSAIFDLDGTIANSIPDLITAMNYMLRGLGFPEAGEAHILRCINHGRREFILGCLPDGIDKESVLEKAYVLYDEYYNAHALDATFPYKGVPELIAALHSAGIKICVLSNKPDNMTKMIVSALYNPAYFTEIRGAKEEFPHKPNPASALYLAKLMQADPADTVFIGDSNVDIETAVNANMFPIGVTWGYRDESVLKNAGAKLIVNTPEEIEAFLR